jgi:hypothetical protein
MYLLFSLIAIFALCIIYFLKTNREHFTNSCVPFQKSKPIIWLYWENKPGKTMPTYLDLCLDTIKFHCQNDFDIILLNEKTVYEYLPDLRTDLDDLLIAQKTDYIRIKLLYTYGGIWMDTDTIVMKNLTPIIEKLNYYDFVGFGCTGAYCQNGYPHPSNQLLASRKGTVLFKNILQNLDHKLDQKKANYNYFDLGKKVIWEELSKLRKDNYEYYHYDSSFDGSRLKNKRWMSAEYYFNQDNELLNENNLLVIFLANRDISGPSPTNNSYKNLFEQFLKLSKKKILQQNYWLAKMFRKSLSV